MPVVDMPLEELKSYMGSSPCPSDIDEFWDKSLEEMKSVDPNVEFVPSDFQVDFAECYDLYFTGVNGSRIHAKFARPKNITKPGPAVVQFHGYSGDCGEWTDKLAFVAGGFCVASMDCRGQGGLSEDRGSISGTTLKGHVTRGIDDGPENLIFRNVYLDTAQLAGIVMDMEEVDETKVAAMGGSQGGALTIACAALEPRISRAASMFPFLCDYKRVWDMDLDAGAYEDLRLYFRKYDPLHKREDEIFETLGYIDLQNIAKRITAKVKMGTGLIDTICPPSSQFAAYNKITSEKDVDIYPDFGHEALPHFWEKMMMWIFEMKND